MKKTPKSAFSAVHLFAHQQANGFGTADLRTSREQLAEDKALYLAKRALYQSLWNAVHDGTGELSIRTQTQNARILLDADGLYNALTPVLTDLKAQLANLESIILQHAAHVEAGTDDCGLENLSAEQWAVARLLGELPAVAPQPARATDERCPFLPSATTPQAAPLV